MFEYFKGKLVEKNPAEAIIDCNGIAYYLNISLQTYSQIKDSENVLLYSHLVVKEDNQELYGFASKSERDIFRHLISVSGVGANTARMILSSLTVGETFNAIANDDEVTLQSVKGIGGKTAKRIILDLKDKIIKDNLSEQIIDSSHNTHKNEALTALVNLGFVKNSASKALDKVIAVHGSNLSLEDLIKFTLQKL